METLPSVKHKVFKTLGLLPPQGLEELSGYLDFLAFKYHSARSDQVLALDGRWRDIAFDVDDEDVRALRRQVTNELLHQDDNHGLPG